MTAHHFGLLPDPTLNRQSGFRAHCWQCSGCRRWVAQIGEVLRVGLLRSFCYIFRVIAGLGVSGDNAKLIPDAPH